MMTTVIQISIGSTRWDLAVSRSIPTKTVRCTSTMLKTTRRGDMMGMMWCTKITVVLRLILAISISNY